MELEMRQNQVKTLMMSYNQKGRHPQQPKDCTIITKDATTNRLYTFIYCMFIQVYTYIRYNTCYSIHIDKDIAIHTYCMYVYKIHTLLSLCMIL